MTETRTYIDENGNTVVEEYKVEPEGPETTVIIDDPDVTPEPSEDADEESEESEEDKPSEYDITTDGIPDWAYPDTSKVHIRLADGTRVKATASLSSISDDLWIWVDTDSGLNFMATAMLFMDVTKTSVIVYVNMLGSETTYEGYSRMAGINIEKDGRFTICMKKP